MPKRNAISFQPISFLFLSLDFLRACIIHKRTWWESQGSVRHPAAYEKALGHQHGLKTIYLPRRLNIELKLMSKSSESSQLNEIVREQSVYAMLLAFARANVACPRDFCLIASVWASSIPTALTDSSPLQVGLLRLSSSSSVAPTYSLICILQNSATLTTSVLPIMVIHSATI